MNGEGVRVGIEARVGRVWGCGVGRDGCLIIQDLRKMRMLPTFSSYEAVSLFV